MKTLIIHTETKTQLTAIKALKIPFEIEKRIYDPGFIVKIQEGMAQVKRGETRAINISEL